jgi:hypothetical protein
VFWWLLQIDYVKLFMNDPLDDRPPKRGLRQVKQSQLGKLIAQITLPLLAVLNTVDAALSFYLFRIYGIGIERNPVINAVLKYDNTAFLLLALKLSGSVLVLAYWLTAKEIKPLIHILGTIGVAVYLTYFGNDLTTIIHLLSIQN